jgi:DNA-binding LacI/PurR family transcriptional regulator
VDVTKLAGVSRATVSAYINGTRYVSPKLSEKIEGLLSSGCTTSPPPRPGALKMKDANTVGMVIPVRDHAPPRISSWRTNPSSAVQHNISHRGIEKGYR